MERKYLEMIENLCSLNGKLEAIIESSTNGIVELDNKGLILNWNPSFCTIFHRYYKNSHPLSLWDIFKDPVIQSEIQPILENGESLYLNDFMLYVEDEKKNSFHKFVELKLIPVPAGHKIQFVGIIKDKSEILMALENREKFISSLLNIIEDIKVDNRNTIYHLASLVELRDNVTGKHLERVEAFTRLLAKEYLSTFGSRDHWVNDQYVEDMALSSVLHDIGKVGISDAILLKPDSLTEIEYSAIKQHTLIAGKALEKHKGQKDFLSMSREIALTHHEKWNGEGYPRQLSGLEIPLSGRIVSLCDTYDAITNERPYKKALPHEDAVKIIQEESGESFDPEIVGLFLQIQSSFEEINQKMK